MENAKKGVSMDAFLMQFKMEYPHLSLLFSDDIAKNILFKKYNVKDTLKEDETITLKRTMLMLVFALQDKKQNYERAYSKFLQVYFCDRQVHFYLMQNMPLFAELDASLDEEIRKKFIRARQAEKRHSVLSAIRTIGLSKIFDRPPKKELNKQINDPIFNEIIKLIIDSGILQGD